MLENSQKRKGSIAVIGLGYVGLSTAACFAFRGFHTVGVDKDVKRLAMLQKGLTPIHEPKLDKMLRNCIELGFLKFTSNPKDAAEKAGAIFITVGTPSLKDGSVDLSYVKEASISLGKALRNMEEYRLLAVKSTVPPTTTLVVVKPLVEKYSKKELGEYGLCSNPEFLREGSAIDDTLSPDRIVIGEADKKSGDELESLYRKFHEHHMPTVIRTTTSNAELIKYSNNAFLAMKVSYINMIANLCQLIPGADVEAVAAGIGLDERIGSKFLKAGIGWGGSCFPKDLKALLSCGKSLGLTLPLIEATIKINEQQPYKAVELAESILGKLKDKRIALLGLSFKPETDDVREATSIKVVKALLQKKAKVTVYDPAAIPNAKKLLGKKVHYAGSPRECITNADCCIIATEWEEFKHLKPEDFICSMMMPVIVDGRRIYDSEEYTGKVKFTAIGLSRNN